MKGNGIRSDQLSIDGRELMRFKRTFTRPVPKRREEGFAKAGIVAFHGRARFVGPNAVQLGDEVLEARFVVIAAGQKPADLKIPGQELLTTSEQFLELDEAQLHGHSYRSVFYSSRRVCRAYRDRSS
jgi:glutathione reductase (NADPH)